MIQRRSIVKGLVRLPLMVASGAGMVASVAGAAGQGGGDPRFASVITTPIGGQPVRLVLTGTAVRTKFMLSMYTIASYLHEGVKVRDAAELIAVNAPKQLHLVFERSVAA